MVRALADERRYQVMGYAKVEGNIFLRRVCVPSVWAESDTVALLKVEAREEGFLRWSGLVEVTFLSEARWMEARGEGTLFNLGALVGED